MQLTHDQFAGRPEPHVLRTVAAALQGASTSSCPRLTEGNPDVLLAVARSQGVAPLIAWTGRTSSGQAHSGDLWAAVWGELNRDLREAALVETMKATEMRRILDSLASGGLRPLVFKGAALAYTDYEEPFLRPCLDTDLLIRRERLDALCRALEALGYQASPQNTGEFVAPQRGYEMRVNGLRHALDVHWKPATPQVFANVLSLEALEAEAVEVPSLGARTFSRAHTLLMACTHLIAHHAGRARLIWLYDLHLLVRRLSRDDLERFVSLAAERGVEPVCLRSLDLASEWLGTKTPPWVLERLRQGSRAPGTARFDVFLHGRPGHFQRLQSNLRELPTRRQRLRLLAEHAFPPSSFIATRYGTTSRVALPVLYGHRIISGAWRWLVRGRMP